MVEFVPVSTGETQLAWIAERDPDRALALLAAPAEARDALATLFVLDLRLAAVADRGGEPAARLLRLAWWRDALAALDAAPAPPEPLLRDLAASILGTGVAGKTLARLAEGWLALAEDPASGEAIDEHAVERGGTLFDVAGRLCGQSDDRLAAAGAAWALAERAARIAEPAIATTMATNARARLAALHPGRWPRRLRGLGTLVTLARYDLGRRGRGWAAARLWHAFRHRLTGG